MVAQVSSPFILENKAKKQKAANLRSLKSSNDLIRIENAARSSAGRNNLEPIKPPEIRRPIFKSFCNNSNMDYHKLSLTG